MATLLVISTGITDVQLVLNGKRQELAKKQCGELHDAIEHRFAECELVDAPLSKDGYAEGLPDGPTRLCTPKLDAALTCLPGDVSEVAVLILETRRRGRPEDPRFAGAILERRLRDLGIADITRHAYLKEEDGDFADRGERKDTIIRRDVISRIDCAVRDVMTPRFDRVVVASTGGPPPIASLIDEVALLHSAGVQCDLIEIEDGAKRDPPARDIGILRLRWDPAESFRARRHAIHLITGGNLLAAWGAVQHLDSDAVERQWTQVVKWLADFAASLPLPPECDIQVLRDANMAVHAAVRVELALKTNDVPRAVHGTVAFFESALWDHLRRHLTEVNINSRVYRVEPAPCADLIRTGSDPEKDRKLPFERVDGGYKVYDDKVPGIRLAKRYLSKPHLEALGKAVEHIRELRNDVAHNEPTPGLMASARDKMRDAGLWSASDEFLTQPLVRGVLDELGVSQPDALWDDLIAVVQERMLAHRVMQ